jgi:histidyl-tRNA synthetase
MVAAQRQELAYPARLYSIANFMRYERPQRGREREFWQLNVDIFGDDGISAEAEIITMASKIMGRFGADASDFVIKINNRKLINFIMAEYFSLNPNQAVLMTKLFDRKNKISGQDFIEQATEIFGDNAKEGIKKVDRLLQSKTLAELPPEIRETSGIRDIQCLFTLLERAGISNLVFDVTLMRGLDYYTGMVFEVFDTDPNNARSLFGGGRYDGLVGLFGAEPISAVGMAPGGTMIENFLDVHGLTPKLHSTTDVYVSVLGDTVSQAVELANKMRDKGLNVEVDNSGRKLDRQLKIVLKKAIPYVLFVGDDEVKSKLYTLRNMAESKEYKLSLTDIVRLIKE